MIPSQLSAKLSVEQWARGHRSQIKDGDGLSWQLRVSSRQKPAQDSVRQLIWEVTFSLHTAASPEDLVVTGTLDAADDERLLSLLGGQTVPFALKPKTVEANQEEEAYRLAGQVLSEYITKIEATSLANIKRQLIGRFINDQMRFSQHD